MNFSINFESREPDPKKMNPIIMSLILQCIDNVSLQYTPKSQNRFHLRRKYGLNFNLNLDGIGETPTID